MFHCLFSNSARYINLGLFWLILECCQNEELRLGHDITTLKHWFKKWITNLKNGFRIWSIYHTWNIVYKFGLFLAPFWLHKFTRIVDFPNFGNMMEDTIFHLKTRILPSLELSIVVWLWQIVLRNFRKWQQKGAPISHLPSNILQKI